MGSPDNDIMGTESVPPPIPIIDENVPMTAAMRLPIQPRGTRLVRRRWSSGRNIFTATSAAITPKTPVNSGPAALAASRLPSSPPASIPGAQAFTSDQSTAPRAWWARDEEIAVGTMTASDVATATCMHHSGGTPLKRRLYSRTGTSTMPPPTPSSPATTPATMPATSRTSSRGQSALKSINAAQCR